MSLILAIRRENKGRWERRVPLTPANVATLTARPGFNILVEPSELRAFSETAYVEAGAAVASSIEAADLVVGVKEIPIEHIQPHTAHLFFSHTHKGQPYNMAMLQHILDVGATLIDYELITNAAGRRTVAFGKFAGYAGAIETFVALSKKLDARNLHPNPFSHLSPPHDYRNLEHAMSALAEVAERIRNEGLPEAASPLRVGVLGYGNVAQGVQGILNALPITWLEPAELARLGDEASKHQLYGAVFKEEHMARRCDGSAFDLETFMEHPELFESAFAPHLATTEVIFTGIYWDPRYPVYIPNALLGEAATYLIGDITCDISGSVQATSRATNQESPCLTYLPSSDTTVDGIEAEGVTVMAIDNLPCELPVDASRNFSETLLPYLENLTDVDFSADSPAAAGLSAALARATIVWRGRLMPRFAHLIEHPVQ